MTLHRCLYLLYYCQGSMAENVVQIVWSALSDISLVFLIQGGDDEQMSIDRDVATCSSEQFNGKTGFRV